MKNEKLIDLTSVQTLDLYLDLDLNLNLNLNLNHTESGHGR
jgi:hypothetical protein